MMLVEEMAVYINRGVATPSLVAAEKSLGGYDLRFVCITLLSWLKSQARFPRVRAIKLGEADYARKTLGDLIENDNSFSALFCVDDGAVKMRETIAPAEVEKICLTAAELYQPRLAIRCH